MRSPSRLFHSVALMAPALVMVGLLFVYPLVYSLAFAFRNEQTGGWDLGNFAKAFSLYGGDIALTAGVTVLSTVLVGVFAIAVAGYITLGENPRAVALLRWIYRWPLFIPFVVAAQLMRTFLAKNGMLNNALSNLPTEFQALRNPLSADLSQLRISLIPSLIEVIRRNRAVGERDVEQVDMVLLILLVRA